MPDQTKYHEFDAKAVNDAIASMKAEPQAFGALAADGQPPALTLQDSGQMFAAAQCIGVTVQNRKICLNLPLRIGKVCLPVPSFVPNGKAAEACIGICTHWGVPTGLKVTVTVAGKVILQKTYGYC
jgi:hypothetical protein